jgi:signal transduction histidine kinase
MPTLRVSDELYQRIAAHASSQGVSNEIWLEQNIPVFQPDKHSDTTRRHLEECYQTIVENFPNGLIALYDHDLRYRLVKGDGLARIGLTSADFEGKRLRDVFPPAVYERDEPTLRAALRGERTTVIVPFGNEFFRVMTLPVYDSKGEIIYGLVMSQNITDLENAKRLEAERASLVQKLEHEHTLAELRSELLSIISHEFRTPLSIIMSASQILQRYNANLTDQKRREKLSAITEQIKHLDQMLSEVDTLLHTNRAFLEYHPAPVDVVALCQSILSDVECTTTSAHTIALDAQANAPTAYIDSNLVRHALANLLSNAIKYSPDGGEIVLSVVECQGDWRFCVSDQGIGIPLPDQEKLFQPFSRATNVGDIRGTGLGLSIVRQIAELHGGTVTVESQPGEGSRFILIVPSIADKAV